jgi:peptidoglycan/LPS O-acetylase OafA/YrhL
VTGSIERVRAAARPSADAGSLAPLTGFRPDVQALRGVAVLAVVLYHAQVVLPGGFVGVDVFFVISGFVIGRVLLAELQRTGRVSFRDFYVRRARRLLPALAALLAVVALLTPLLAPLDAGDVTRGTAVAAALFSANLYLYDATEGGYFEAAAEQNPLLHTWSLSVEEQFYFAVPVLLVAAWRIGRRRGHSLTAVRGFLVALFVASLALCLVASFRDQLGPLDGLRFAFYAPVTRAWQFAAGLALVVLPARWIAGPRLRRASFVAGAALLATSMLAFDASTRFPGAAALLPTVGTALLIHAGTTGAAAAPARPALRPLIRLGDLSYSWYLWHWPLIVFAGAAAPNAGRWPLVVAAFGSLVPAWLSYRALERPLRVHRHAPPRRTLALALACIAAPLAAAAFVPAVTSALETRLPTDAYAASQRWHADRATEPHCDDPAPLGERDPDRCVWDFSDGADDGEVLLVGDSNAGHYSEAVIGAAEAEGRELRIATLSACRFWLAADPADDDRDADCRDFVTGTIAAIEADPPDVVVVANATDHTIFRGEERRAEVVRTGAGDPDPVADDYEAGFRRAVDRVVAAGAEVAIITTSPKVPGWDVRECARWTLAGPVHRCLPSEVRADNRVVAVSEALERRVAAATGAHVWDLTDHLCPGEQCPSVRQGALSWRDGGHISVAASEELGPHAADLLRATSP